MNRVRSDSLEATVVLVRTRGPSAWLAAERRLAAELESLELDVIAEPSVRQVDPLLPERAQRHGAFVAVQVMRNGDRGVVRLWFAHQAHQANGYQHVELNLRNPDVVSRAVLPTVEAIYDRARISRVEDMVSDEEADDAVDDEECLYAGVDCRPRLSLRLGAGPWVVTASSVTSFAGVLGGRSRIWSGIALDYELTYQRLGGAEEVAPSRGMALLRSHVLADVWTRKGRGLALGVGAGAVGGAASSEPNGVHPLLSTRAVLYARASERLDVVFAASAARAFGVPDDVPRRGYFADVMLALDWHVWM